MAWSDVTLAEPADVRDRYARVDELCDSESTPVQDEEINDYIARAKAYIGRKLDVIILSRYADKDFGSSNPKDMISNPDILKDSCVAWTLKLLFEKVELNDGDYNSVKKEDFKQEFKDEFNTASALLKFDDSTLEKTDSNPKNPVLADNIFYRI